MNIIPPLYETDDSIKRLEFTSFLDKICQKLELSPSQLHKAQEYYEDVSNWLSNFGDSPIELEQIYLNGSIALETTVKPLKSKEFDVDIICQVIPLDYVNTLELKKLIGDRLKEDKYFKKIIKEKKRCWRLNYAGDFHLDISPTIKHALSSKGEELIPDRDRDEFQITNPRGYIKLFKKRAKEKLNFADREVYEREMILAKYEPFPISKKKKGMLRRIVQLLKRHRDIYFQERDENIAPTSIIITTLVMRSYEFCAKHMIFKDEWDVLMKTIERMPKYINIGVNGEYIVNNETTDDENFAIQWNHNDLLHKAFSGWYEQVMTDFHEFLSLQDLEVITSSLQKKFGKNVVREIFSEEQSHFQEARMYREIGLVPITSSRTPIDVIDVLQELYRDFELIGQSTGAISAAKINEYMHDIQLLAKKGYLKKVDITQIENDIEIHAVQYKFRKIAIPKETYIPGGLNWSPNSQSKIRVVLSYTNKYTPEESTKMSEQLIISWVPTDADLSHKNLNYTTERSFSSGGVELKRKNWD